MAVIILEVGVGIAVTRELPVDAARERAPPGRFAELERGPPDETAHPQPVAAAGSVSA